MGKTERTKYYPISLKDKKLHDEFMMRKLEIGSKNVDDALTWLLEQISLRIDTRYRLEAMKRPDESWDGLLNRLMDGLENKDVD